MYADEVRKRVCKLDYPEVHQIRIARNAKRDNKFPFFSFPFFFFWFQNKRTYLQTMYMPFGLVRRTRLPPQAFAVEARRRLPS